MVCIVTDRARFPGSDPERQAALVRAAARWAAADLAAAARPDFVQLREKDLAAAELAALARKLLAALGSAGRAPKLLINSRADVAIAVAAAGVHLTAAPGELTPAQVRRLYAAAGLPEPIVSVSCHTLAEVARAAPPDPASAAGYILFGPVFEKAVFQKRGGQESIAAGVGLEQLRAACTAAAPVPVLALGGVTRANTADCLAVGAAGIAGIRLFVEESWA